MIVKHHSEGWEIISHYAHGLLAGKIASQLSKDLMPEHWVDVLTAIVEHDDHLLNFEEQDYLTKNGTPKDFTMESNKNREALEHAQRVYANAMQKSQLVALLVGRHLEFLNEDLAEDFKPMEQFLEDIDALRAQQRKLYGLLRKDEDNLYDIMLFSDRCSLILCQDKIPEVGRKLEINNTIRNKTYFIYQDNTEKITVEPWPFEHDKIKLDFEYRIIPQATFKNNQELKKLLDDVEIGLHLKILKKTNG